MGARVVEGGGLMGSRGGGEPSTSLPVKGSGRTFSVLTGLVRMDVELCRRVGSEDAGRSEDVDGFGCSSSSPSTTSTARSLPFLLLGLTEARAVCPSSVAPNDRARETRLHPFLDEGGASERALVPWIGPEESLDFPTRPIMLLRIVDLRERFGRSDEATVPSSADMVEEVGNWLDGPAVEGELEALDIFCFDGVWPISIQGSIEADSVWLRREGGRDTPRGVERGSEV